MIGQAPYYAQSLHRQFRSALLMLLDAMHKVPIKLWKQPMWLVQGRNPVFSQPWYVIYHALFFADLYLETSDIGYTPPAPFNLDELDPAGKPPAKVLNQHELEQFIEHILAKADSILPNLDEVSAQKVAAFSWGFSLPYQPCIPQSPIP